MGTVAVSSHNRATWGCWHFHYVCTNYSCMGRSGKHVQLRCCVLIKCPWLFHFLKLRLTSATPAARVASQGTYTQTLTCKGGAVMEHAAHDASTNEFTIAQSLTGSRNTFIIKPFFRPLLSAFISRNVSHDNSIDRFLPVIYAGEWIMYDNHPWLFLFFCSLPVSACHGWENTGGSPADRTRMIDKRHENVIGMYTDRICTVRIVKNRI